jgi:hypothetical protein
MLLSLFSLTCLLAVQLAKGGTCIPGIKPMAKPAMTGNNYVVDSFYGLSFAYAIGYCTAIDIKGNYGIYTCNSDGSVSKSTYLTNDCSDTGTTTKIAAEMAYCKGNNNYVTVDVAIDDITCASAVTVYAGLGACVNDFGLFSQVYCDSKQAIVQFYLPYYMPTTTMMAESSSSTMMESSMMESSSSMMAESSSSMMAESSSSMMAESSSSSMEPVTTGPTIQYCDSNLLCLLWEFTPSTGSCTQVGALAGGIPVYGSLGTCDTSVTANSNKKSASSLVAVINLIVGFAVALFSLF